jgi:segregation and condensation protein B
MDVVTQSTDTLEALPDTEVTVDTQATLDLDTMPSGARGAVEAVLMVVEEPVTEMALASALGLPVDRVGQLLRELADEYDQAGRGFELRHVAGGWRVYSRPEYAGAVERFVLDGQTARLTQAALETLSIVAYRQPISRARVGAVRGVNVDAVMRTLLTRGLVTEAGHDGETGAVLYRTTDYFLHRIGLTNLDELPALAPFLPEVDALDELGVGGMA